MREDGTVVGRDGEILEVARTLVSTGDSARTLLIVGGAGSGKTAVLEQARRAAVEEGAEVLRLRCHDGGSATGAAALADGVHHVLTRIHDRRSAVRTSAVRRIRLQATGRAGELTLLSVLSEILADAARRLPFAVVVDDVERLPSPTASALALLLRVFRPTGVPMVMAGRPAHPGDDGVPQLTAAADRLLELPPLRPAEVETLVVRRLGRPVEPALVTAVLRALGPMAGIPEAVLSVLDSMEERGDLLELDGHVCLTEPEHTLRLGTDVAQLGRLCWPGAPPDAVALDAAAAVARNLEHTEIRLADLHRLKPGGPRRAGLVDRTVTPLIRDGILTVNEDGRMAFAVPALAAALRALPTRHAVPSLHALIVRSLSDRLGAETAGSCCPRLADHVAAAGTELDDTLAVDLLLAAGRADARSDWPRSVRAYASALRRLGPHDPRTPRVLRESAELSLHHADHAGALALGEPLLACLDSSSAERDGEGLRFVAGVWALAGLHEHRSPYAPTGPRGRDGLERLPTVAELAALAGPYGLPEPARPADGESGPTDGEARAAGGVRTVGAGKAPGPEPAARRPGTGPLPSPAEVRLLAAASGSRAGLLGALVGALPPEADTSRTLDRLRDAAAHADLAGALTAVLGDRYAGAGDSTAAHHHAMVRDYLSGDWDRALAHARRIEARSRTVGTEAAAAQPARALAAEIHCARGELGRARAWLGLIPDTVPHPLVAWVRLGVGYWSGGVAEARERARADVRRARRRGLLSGLERVLLRCLAYAVLEDLPQVMREAMDELEALHEEVGSPMTYEAVLFGRGLVHGCTDSALAALRSVQRRGDVYLGLLCHLCLVELGHDSEGRLAEASRIAQALGIGRATRTTLGHMARRQSVVLRRPRPDKDALSEADVRLTVLVSDGATNRQIAARLAWSEKTVERRLTQLFQRTGCRSRVELAAAWWDGSLARRALVADSGPDGAPDPAGGSFPAADRETPPGRR
ncbi:LuxR family transcriptional regulator [Streptomyces sp. NPDC002588]|uniref:helix-turn-helix transcriptional regulator n=1 Tax=Streptomyces sp. NPDC002588 TaxID=3154419 RepID=UPI00333453A9